MLALFCLWLFSLMGLSEIWKVVLSVLVVFGLGFGPAIALKPGVGRVLRGLLAMMLAFVVDAFITGSYDQSQEMDRQVPVPVELFLCGIIAFGWLIGATVNGFIRKSAGIK